MRSPDVRHFCLEHVVLEHLKCPTRHNRRPDDGARGRRALRLTATRYLLLEALSLDAGGVATYEKPMRRVWSEKGGGNIEALRSAVAKLRRRLGDYARKPR